MSSQHIAAVLMKDIIATRGEVSFYQRRSWSFGAYLMANHDGSPAMLKKKDKEQKSVLDENEEQRRHKSFDHFHWTQQSYKNNSYP
mmetsp:Transcript_34946/g.57038  ORF Transcript_34946/g.57038 Transcript_34946/m.57038 type:complete len:86 (-) Transcript_34946:139-396(-)